MVSGPTILRNLKFFVSNERLFLGNFTLQNPQTRVASQENRNSIDLGLEEKNELAACMHIAGCTHQS